MSYERDFEQLSAFLNSIDLDNLPENWKERITELFNYVISSNTEFNLTRITSFNEFLFKHVADSLLLKRVIPDIISGSFMVGDVGCGAGFPGFPLALFFLGSTFIEIDSNKRKGAFVKSLIKSANLTNCHAVTGRARELARMPEYKGKFDLVLTRAVKKTAAMIRECRQLLRPDGGTLVVYKTPDAVFQERQVANREASKYKLQLSESPVFVLPNDYGRRQFHLIKCG